MPVSVSYAWKHTHAKLAKETSKPTSKRGTGTMDYNVQSAGVQSLERAALLIGRKWRARAQLRTALSRERLIERLQLESSVREERSPLLQSLHCKPEWLCSSLRHDFHSTSLLPPSPIPSNYLPTSSPHNLWSLHHHLLSKHVTPHPLFPPLCPLFTSIHSAL